ncbi:MAG: hypothetical protein JWO62_2182 [Acidimicrobiaceae bacterium]|nr:hypothetical protein [Acidimicrobiaceae bacterium]
MASRAEDPATEVTGEGELEDAPSAKPAIAAIVTLGNAANRSRARWNEATNDRGEQRSTSSRTSAPAANVRSPPYMMTAPGGLVEEVQADYRVLVEQLGREGVRLRTVESHGRYRPAMLGPDERVPVVRFRHSAHRREAKPST